MTTKHSNYSPNILIYLEVGENKIRLADVLYDSATLFEKAEVLPNTRASLVFSIDGVEEREDVVLHKGISKKETLVSFSYSNPDRINGRRFPNTPNTPNNQSF